MPKGSFNAELDRDLSTSLRADGGLLRHNEPVEMLVHSQFGVNQLQTARICECTSWMSANGTDAIAQLVAKEAGGSGRGVSRVERNTRREL